MHFFAWFFFSRPNIFWNNVASGNRFISESLTVLSETYQEGNVTLIDHFSDVWCVWPTEKREAFEIRRESLNFVSRRKFLRDVKKIRTNQGFWRAPNFHASWKGQLLPLLYQEAQPGLLVGHQSWATVLKTKSEHYSLINCNDWSKWELFTYNWSYNYCWKKSVFCFFRTWP